MMLDVHRQSVVGAEKDPAEHFFSDLGRDIGVAACDLGVTPNLVEDVGVGERSGSIGGEQRVDAVLHKFGDDASVVANPRSGQQVWKRTTGGGSVDIGGGLLHQQLGHVELGGR